MAEFEGSTPIGGVKILVEMDETPYQKALAGLKARVAKNEGMPRLKMASTAQQAFAAQWGMNNGNGSTAPGGHAAPNWGTPGGGGGGGAFIGPPPPPGAGGGSGRRRPAQRQAGTGGGTQGGIGGRNSIAGTLLELFGLPITSAASAYMLTRSATNAVAQVGPAISSALTAQQSAWAAARGDNVMAAQYRAKSQQQIIDMTRSIPVIGGAEASAMENMPAAMRWMQMTSAGRAARQMANGIGIPIPSAATARRFGFDLTTDFQEDANTQAQARESARTAIGGMGGYLGAKRQMAVDRQISQSNIQDMAARGDSAATIAKYSTAKNAEFSIQSAQLEFARRLALEQAKMSTQQTNMAAMGMGYSARLLSIKQQNYEGIETARAQGDTELQNRLEGLQSSQLRAVMLGGRRVAQQINPMDEALSFGSVRTEGLSGQDLAMLRTMMNVAENTSKPSTPIIGRD